VPFTDRFQLLDLKHDEGVRTYEAREIATGRPVFVHLFADCAAPLNRGLLAKIDALPEEERSRILDRGPHEGGVYLVTDRLAEYSGLQEWLKAKSDKPLNAGGAWKIVLPAPDPPAPVSPLGNSGERTLQMPIPVQPPAANDPGEFTRLFARPAAAPQPGEFTQLFAVPGPQRPAPAPAPPGEFTQMLQAQRPASPTPPAHQPSPDGEFTRFFQSPMTPSNPQPHAAPMTPLRPPAQPRDAGEFTQIFGRGDMPSPPPPPSPASASANATQVFATPRPAPAAQDLNRPMGPPIPQAPGEYTQMFAKPAPLTFGQAPSGAPRLAEAPIQRNESRLPLLLVLGAIVLLIIAILVYFLIRPPTA
jgi:hypothetical protein